MWSLNDFNSVENDKIEDSCELKPTLIHQTELPYTTQLKWMIEMIEVWWHFAFQVANGPNLLLLGYASPVLAREQGC